MKSPWSEYLTGGTGAWPGRGAQAFKYAGAQADGPFWSDQCGHSSLRFTYTY